MVREYSKWDDLPISLEHFGESAVRAYKIAMTPPMGPVVIVADSDLQETPVEKSARLRVPKLTLSSPPTGEPSAVAAVAKLLVAAESPVLLADRCGRLGAGMKNLGDLAAMLET